MHLKFTWLVTPLVLVGSLHLVQGQQPFKIARIGYLIPSTPSAAVQNVEAFRQGLRELGHIEGKTYVLELRYGEARPEH